MELDFIRWLRSRTAQHPQLEVGIGDDAAVLRFTPGAKCVVTSDLIAEGTHFRLNEVGAARIGRKALAVNLSDLAAMAARPVAAVVSLLLPRSGGADLARDLYAELLPLAEKYSVAIAGGDTNSWDGGLVISLTLLGETTTRGPLLRSGAKPGDAILVTGSFGGSIAGKHLDFEPRIDEALKLHEQFELHAGIDVTDGLSLDLWRVCQESGCGAVLDLPRIPISSAAQDLAHQSGDVPSALDRALSDGEDFELLLAVPPSVAKELVRTQPLGVPLTWIGEFISEVGLWSRDAQGSRLPLSPRGFEH